MAEELLEPGREVASAMMIAVPLFETEVAPRFCFAREILVASVEAGEVIARARVFSEPMTWPERIRLLERMGVELILASGFNRCQIPMASAHGIRVVCGLRGDVEEVLEAYCRGELEPGLTSTPPRSPQSPGSSRPVRRRRRNRGQRGGAASGG